MPASLPPTARIFVVDESRSAVLTYAPGASGDVAPDRVIGRSLTGPGIAVDSTGRTYVANAWLNTISIFAPDATGEAPPIAIIRGGKTELDSPEGVALDGRGNLYVANAGYYDPDVGRVTVYAAGGEGNVAPVATIGGLRTGLHECWDVAVDSGGRIYVANGGVHGNLGNVTVYSAGSEGDVSPIATIGGPKSGVRWPQGIDVDSRGRIYVANSSGGDTRAVGTVTVYRGGSNGDVPPIATIRATTGSPQGVAVGPGGRIYLTRNLWMGEIPARALPEPHAVLVYRLGPDGNVVRIATIAGPGTDLDGPAAIALDSAGRMHVTNTGSGANGNPATITVYPAGADGDVSPIATLTGEPDPGIDLPEGIALDSTGKIYVTNLESVTVYPAGTDYNARPMAAIRGPATRLVRPSGIAVDSAGGIYVANRERTPDPVEPGAVTVYRADADGDVAPNAVLTGPGIGSNPGGVAVDANGNLYVVNRGDWGKGSIAIYPGGSRADVVPLATVAGEHTGIAGPSGIALDAIGRIYLANEGYPRSDAGSVTVYPPLAKLVSVPGYPDVKPLATIAGTNAALAHPRSIAVDSIGRVYVLQHHDYESHEGPIPVVTEVAGINVYLPLDERGGVRDEAPVATIAGANTRLDMSPSALVVGPIIH